MAISKITLNGDVQMDVTQDTVTANKLLYGETATGADGVGVTGNIATKTSSNMTVSGATVTAPAGYYATNASKSVASGSAKTPTTTITANPTISVSSAGLITATTSASQSITPTVTAGYVSAGTAGTVSVSGSKTQQLTTQAAKTVTPTTSSQTAVASGRYTTGAVTVAAIPSQYIVPSGTKTITENGTGIDVAAYASVDVNVSSGGSGDEVVPVYITVEGSYKTYVHFRACYTGPNSIMTFDGLANVPGSSATNRTKFLLPVTRNGHGLLFAYTHNVSDAGLNLNTSTSSGATSILPTVGAILVECEENAEVVITSYNNS